MEDGTVWACGKNDDGQLGIGQNEADIEDQQERIRQINNQLKTSPVQIQGLSDIIEIYCSQSYSYAVDKDR